MALIYQTSVETSAASGAELILSQGLGAGISDQSQCANEWVLMKAASENNYHLSNVPLFVNGLTQLLWKLI